MAAKKLEKCPYCGSYPIDRVSIIGCINLDCPVQPLVQAQSGSEAYSMWSMMCNRIGDRTGDKQNEKKK